MAEPAIDRIPLAHSVRYAVRGLPEVPNQYGPGVLVPSEITLTYKSATDSQLGRVHAYVAGRIWVDGKETPLLPGGLYGQHYFDGLDGWPEWLAEEAQLHDPETAEPAAVGRRAADETPGEAEFTESVIYEVVGDWGVDSADSAEGARAAVAKWLRAYPKCGAHAQQRIVRDWPDGSEFYGPWTDLPEQPAVGAQQPNGA
jgi:hypothetical protein